MKKYFELLNTVAQEYNIIRGKNEDELSWKTRVVYSLLSQIGYASLFDLQEDLKPASIVHFKSKITDTLSSLIDMYPELRGQYTEDNSLADEMYDVFLAAGCVYHEPDRITPCIRALAQGGRYYFLRGQSIEEKKWISGMGCYFPFDKDNTPNDMRGLIDHFGLQKNTLAQYWSSIIDKSKFQHFTSGIDFEYLKTVPPYRTGYWTTTPDLSGEISLARTVVPGNRMYYLYKYSEGVMMISQLPGWQTDGYKYRSVSVACLASRRTLPPTCFHVDGEIVELQIEYLFPPAELNAIKLYSWPKSYLSLPNDFKRTMSRDVFEEIRSQFEKLGYQFKEV